MRQREVNPAWVKWHFAMEERARKMGKPQSLAHQPPWLLPLVDCTARGKAFQKERSRMHEISIRKGTDSQGRAVGVVFVSGVGKFSTRLKIRERDREKIDPKAVDLERLATIVTLDKVLSYGQHPTIKPILPRPVEAVLELVHTLVKMRREALLSGEQIDKEKFEKFLNLALKSPMRSMRAVAAASLELLK